MPRTNCRCVWQLQCVLSVLVFLLPVPAVQSFSTTIPSNSMEEHQLSREPYDLLVVGGGVVGLAILRQATLHGYKAILLEQEPHLLSHASGHNSGILCTGVDANHLERALIRDSISNVRAFYKAMQLPSRTCGSLVCRYAWQEDHEGGEDERDSLEEVLNASLGAGDTHAKRLTADELQTLEPHLTKQATAAVHIPGETVVDPFLHSVSYACARPSKRRDDSHQPGL